MQNYCGGYFYICNQFLIFGHVICDVFFSKNLEKTPIINLNLEVLGAKNSSTSDQVFFAIRSLAHSTASLTVNLARINLAKMQNSSKIIKKYSVINMPYLNKIGLYFFNLKVIKSLNKVLFI